MDSLIKRNQLNFGTVSLSHNPSRDTVIEIVNYAIKKEKIISLDVNYRAPLWDDKDEALFFI